MRDAKDWNGGSPEILRRALTRNADGRIDAEHALACILLPSGACRNMCGAFSFRETRASFQARASNLGGEPTYHAPPNFLERISFAYILTGPVGY